jgi:hypothetical protein
MQLQHHAHSTAELSAYGRRTAEQLVALQQHYVALDHQYAALRAVHEGTEAGLREATRCAERSDAELAAARGALAAAETALAEQRQRLYDAEQRFQQQELELAQLRASPMVEDATPPTEDPRTTRAAEQAERHAQTAKKWEAAYLMIQAKYNALLDAYQRSQTESREHVQAMIGAPLPPAPRGQRTSGGRRCGPRRRRRRRTLRSATRNGYGDSSKCSGNRWRNTITGCSASTRRSTKHDKRRTWNSARNCNDSPRRSGARRKPSRPCRTGSAREAACCVAHRLPTPRSHRAPAIRERRAGSVTPGVRGGATGGGPAATAGGDGAVRRGAAAGRTGRALRDGDRGRRMQRTRADVRGCRASTRVRPCTRRIRTP